MSFLDDIPGVKDVIDATATDAGITLPRRHKLKIKGDGVSLRDDAANRITEITITGGAGSLPDAEDVPAGYILISDGDGEPYWGEPTTGAPVALGQRYRYPCEFLTDSDTEGAWVGTVISGGATFIVGSPVEDHPGVKSVIAGPGPTQSIYTIQAQNIQPQLGTVFECEFRTPNSFTPEFYTEHFAVFGFFDSTDSNDFHEAAGVDGIYVYYNASGDFKARVRSLGTVTTVDLLELDISEWYQLRIEVTDDDEVTFTVASEAGVQLAQETITKALPEMALGARVLAGQSPGGDADARILSLDYVGVYFTALERRTLIAGEVDVRFGELGAGATYDVVDASADGLAPQTTAVAGLVLTTDASGDVSWEAPETYDLVDNDDAGLVPDLEGVAGYVLTDDGAGAAYWGEHFHGNQAGGSLHPEATSAGAGFAPTTTGADEGDVLTVQADGSVEWEPVEGGAGLVNDTQDGIVPATPGNIAGYSLITDSDGEVYWYTAFQGDLVSTSTSGAVSNTAAQTGHVLTVQGDGSALWDLPDADPIVFDDECINSVAATATSGWGTTASTGTVTPMTSTAGHPGMYQLALASEASQVATSFGPVSETANCRLTLASASRFKCVFQSPSAFAGNGQNVLFIAGFTDGGMGADGGSNAAIFRFNGSGAIIGRCISGGTTSTSTLTTLAASTWYQLELVVNNSGADVTFNVYDSGGSLLGTGNVAANVPTTDMNLYICVSHTGTAAALASVGPVIDYVALEISRSGTGRIR